MDLLPITGGGGVGGSGGRTTRRRRGPSKRSVLAKPVSRKEKLPPLAPVTLVLVSPCPFSETHHEGVH